MNTLFESNLDMRQPDIFVDNYRYEVTDWDIVGDYTWDNSRIRSYTCRFEDDSINEMVLHMSSKFNWNREYHLIDICLTADIGLYGRMFNEGLVVAVDPKVDKNNLTDDLDRIIKTFSWSDVGMPSDMIQDIKEAITSYVNDLNGKEA